MIAGQLCSLGKGQMKSDIRKSVAVYARDSETKRRMAFIIKLILWFPARSKEYLSSETG